jgi:parallel beta-helix repeat protein
MKKLLTIITVLISFSVNATDYFVSNLTGSDVNAGTTLCAPWQTIAKVNSSSFNPGDRIFFKRGEEWREQLTIPSSGTSGNVITFSAYSTGADPIINGADLKTGWTARGGMTNVWVTTATNATTYRAMVIIDDSIFTEVASLAAVNSAGEYYIQTAGTDSLFVYGATDPDSRVAEVSKRDYGILAADNAFRHHIKIENIEVRYAGGGGIGLYSNGTDHDGYVTIDNCVLYANRLWGAIAKDGFNQTVYSNCTAEYNGNGFYAWVSDDNTVQTCSTAHSIQYVIASGAEATTDGGAIQNYQGDDWLVENCYSDDDNDAIHIDAGGVATDAIIRYNKVFRSKVNTPNTPGIGVGSLAAGATINIYYNLLVNNSSAGFESYTASLGTVNFYNNTIYNDATSGSEGNIYLIYGNNFVFKNNLIVQARQDGKAIYYQINAGAGSATLDYNNWYQVGPAAYRWHRNGVNYSTIALWRAGSSQDVNSITGDPLMVNVLSDWSLQAGSPAINAGTNLGLTRDLLGNPIVGLPDIGCYERQ